jgi:hypothetical protein
VLEPNGDKGGEANSRDRLTSTAQPEVLIEPKVSSIARVYGGCPLSSDTDSEVAGEWTLGVQGLFKALRLPRNSGHAFKRLGA